MVYQKLLHFIFFRPEESTEEVEPVEKVEEKPEPQPEVGEEKSKTVTIETPKPTENNDAPPETVVPLSKEELQRKKFVAGLGKYLQAFLGDQTFDDFLRTFAPLIPESKVIYGAEPIQNKWKRNPNTGYWQR